MKIGLVGPTQQERMLPFNAERAINLYPVADKNGKEVSALYSVPGKLLFSTIGTGPIRGTYYSRGSARAFCVSGATLYEVNADGSFSSRGSLNSSSGRITIDENGFQLAICDGQYIYILTYATNAFTQVMDVDVPEAGTLTFIDGYFVVNQIDSGKFFISALYDGLLWDALDFATAESSPDNLFRVINAVGQLWLLGETTSEIWTNTGDSAFPFQRIAGAKMETGVLSPFTAVAVDNSLLWVGRDQYGQGIVYRANGFTPQRISTEAIELKIQAAGNFDDMQAFSYQQDGHTFYFLTGGGLEASLVYDLSTGLWHERAYLNMDGNFEQDRANCVMSCFDKIIVGDREDGLLYSLDADTYDDNGEALCRERIYTHLSDEGKRVRFNTLEIDFEVGVGTQTGQGFNPSCLFRLSNDGARTWSDEYSQVIGKVGQYRNKVRFKRLGVSDIMTFRIRVTDPIPVRICGSYLL